MGSGDGDPLSGGGWARGPTTGSFEAKARVETSARNRRLFSTSASLGMLGNLSLPCSLPSLPR